MEQLVRVKEIRPDGSALVLHMRQSACSGDCHKCSGCGAAQEAIELQVENVLGAEPGDFVTIESATGPVLKAAAVLYLMPMVLFFAGYLAGAVLWERGALVGCLSFVAGIGLAILYDRTVAQKKKPVYTMTGFAGQSLLKHTNKGDNDFD